MNITIIANNCSGAALYEELGSRYYSPTIFLQILPEEYPKFCKNLRHYMNSELKEYIELSETHKKQIKKLIGQPAYFPCGLIDDIAVLFQHCETFAEAADRWNERKQRIDYQHIGYIFTLEKKYPEEAEAFGRLQLPNSVLFTRSYTVDVPIEHYCYEVPSYSEYLATDPVTGHRYFESNFDLAAFVQRISRQGD